MSGWETLGMFGAGVAVGVTVALAAVRLALELVERRDRK